MRKAAVRQKPRSRPGEFSLSLAIGALLALLLPMVGDVVSVVFALASLFLGYKGLKEYERKATDHVWTAIAGMVVAALAILAVVVLSVSS